jgi:hypothetical protein
MPSETQISGLPALPLLDANASWPQPPCPLRSILSEIETLEARICDLTSEENHRLIALCHKAANTLQISSRHPVARSLCKPPLSGLHDRHAKVVNSIRARERSLVSSPPQ